MHNFPSSTTFILLQSTRKFILLLSAAKSLDRNSKLNLVIKTEQILKYSEVQRSIVCGKSTFFDGHGPLVRSHFGVDVSRVNVVHDEVLAAVGVEFPLLDPRQGAHSNLRHDVGASRPALVGKGSVVGGPDTIKRARSHTNSEFGNNNPQCFSISCQSANGDALGATTTDFDLTFQTGKVREKACR